MLIDNIEDYIIFELEYRAANEGQIKLFDSRFLYNCIYSSYIIYDGKEYELTESFKFDYNSIKNDSIKIKLILNKHINDISYLFYNCKALLSIRNIEDNSDINNINKSIYEYNSNNITEEFNNSKGTEKIKLFMMIILHYQQFKEIQIFLNLLE